MEARRVVRTEKQVLWPGGPHPHVAALILEDGRRVEADDAIWRIDIRAAAFECAVGPRTAAVAVARCERCALDHLCTTLDTVMDAHLLALPD
jgi:hypothetical protein